MCVCVRVCLLPSRLNSYSFRSMLKDITKRWNERVIIQLTFKKVYWFVVKSAFPSLPLGWGFFFLFFSWELERSDCREGGREWSRSLMHPIAMNPSCVLSYMRPIHMYLYDCGTDVCTTNNKMKSLRLKSYLVGRGFCCFVFFFPFS